MIIKPAIVIVAYNRKPSLQRLLASISQAFYDYTDIHLIISIDHAVDNKDVLDLANDFQWVYGVKKVVYQRDNLGLRNHILQCGAYAVSYGSAIILEDDLYVSPYFYKYSLAALEFSDDKPHISGISLYSHQFNVHSRSHFSPLIDGYDNWYFQFASSWGQAWTKKQWEGFFEWYTQQGTLKPQSNLPENVTRWSDKSWLKYFIAFLVATDTYFLYPRASYATNFSDKGTHIGKDTTTYQVPLDFGKTTTFNFSTVVESNSVYDVFYENKRLYSYLNLAEKDLCVDLYGKKPLPTHSRYFLTEKILPFKMIRTYGRSLKPHDANIIADIFGDDLFLYDCQDQKANPNRFNSFRKIMYNIKSIGYSEAGTVFLQLYKERFAHLLKKLGL